MTRRLLAAVALALGCGGPDVGEARQPIVGGVVDPGHADVVAVGLARSGPICSGTLISPRVVITAGHCGLDIDTVFFDLSGPRRRAVAVDRVLRHPQFFTPTDIDPFVAEHDVTLLHLAEGLPTQPAPLLRDTLANTPEFIGPDFTFVGYGVVDGVTGAGLGTRRAVSLPIGFVGPGAVGGSLGTINDTLFYFQVPGKNSCNGDSGGPAFVVRDGVERHAGVTSSGDAGCQLDGDVGRSDAPEIAAFLQPTLDALEGGDPCRADGVCNEACNLHGKLVDPDCADRHCGPDRVCALACVAPLDPDCAGRGIDHCRADGVCDPSCAVLDPDCAPLCGQDGTCIPGCAAPDPDCQGSCGDGIIQPGEQCDDGNSIDGDGCDRGCTLSCGNGVVDPGEECDDGNHDETDGCRHCRLPFCGDGIVDPGEQCDDGDNLDGDGCDASCHVEASAGGCAVAPGPGDLGALVLPVAALLWMKPAARQVRRLAARAGARPGLRHAELQRPGPRPKLLVGAGGANMKARWSECLGGALRARRRAEDPNESL